MIFLGKIFKTRGNKGEVVFRPSFSIESFDHWEEKEILLKSLKHQRKDIIEYIKATKSGFILKLINTNTIKEAFQLVGYSLFGIGIQAEESDVEDIINFKVKDVDDVFWGTVFDIKKFGLNVILEITKDNNIIYVPFDKTIVIEIRKDQKLIIIDPPEGLLDLNQ